MHLNDFHFVLPDPLIARYPLERRSASRLLCLNKTNDLFLHKKFYELIDLIEEGDLLVFNNTKVIPARLLGNKPTGGRVEVLLERIIDSKRVLAQIRASKSPRLGDVLLFSLNYALTVTARHQQFYELRLDDSDRSIFQMIECIGKIPLPPYLNREPDERDYERYQTVYAKHQGSVAAPTAGFHFDEPLLEQLKNKNVKMGELVLHIGAGTFSPVRVESIEDHQMHAEYIEVSADLCEQIRICHEQGKRVIAVGTTSLRALETASQGGVIQPYMGDTRIFIYPGFHFRCVDILITNLHLPHSTLLMLVAAFGGYQKVMQAYQEAVKHSYRFYSYGDAMWVEKAI
jgi:S-adenosylmethionine:tRNA ribosyltransferase-isomerase